MDDWTLLIYEVLLFLLSKKRDHKTITITARKSAVGTDRTTYFNRDDISSKIEQSFVK